MRDLVLLGIVVLLALRGLIEPRVGIASYIWFALFRPDLLAFSGRNYYSMILAVATLIGSAREFYLLGRLFQNPFSLLFILLQIPIAVSHMMSVNPAWGEAFYTPFLQMSLMALLIPLLVRTVEDFKMLMLIMAFSTTVLGAKYGLWGILQGGARIGVGPGGFIGENNTFALFLVMGLPIAWFARTFVENKWVKMALLGAAFLTLAAVAMLHSRAGILAGVAVLLYIVYRSRSKVGMAIVVTILAAPGVLLVKDSLTARMATLEDVEAEASARGRLELNKAAIRMIPDYLFTGVGFGGVAFGKISSRYMPGGNAKEHVVHNNYLQMFVDSGIFAFLFYILMFFWAIFWLGHSYKWLQKNRPDLAPISLCLQGSLVGFGVGSVFASRTYYDFIYFLLMSVGAWYMIVGDLRALAQAAAYRAAVPARTPPPAALPGPEPAVLPEMAGVGTGPEAERRRPGSALARRAAMEARRAADPVIDPAMRRGDSRPL